ncbi:acyloxyacyl hydrolase [Acidovorax sp. SRB_24]|uniref:acyloxyacyl hydrolase n=1 Tax=Acidovorax sp. SRB_24 TaxID=1962700 RepID=UPI001F10F014|nr:acyloxyacyl hydrolase [Acidovorax sp. SRB_24]
MVRALSSLDLPPAARHAAAHAAHRRRPVQRLARTAALAGAMLSTGAHAQLLETPSVYLQAGWAGHHSASLTLGTTRPWAGWERRMGAGVLTGHWNLYASQWRSERANGREHSTVLGLVPTLRLHPGGGRSRWFIEGGLGLALFDRLYSAGDRHFSSRVNFDTHIGVGGQWGEQGRNEWLLQLQHVSNGGFKQPNPGENFLQLRYARHF